jgi:hypothetical protein
MKTLYRGPYIDAFCQVWFHLALLFQRSRLKYEKGNFEENLITYLGVIALFSSNFQNFNTFGFFISKTIRDRC